MIERPILFSAPMVRALLNGTKTQTRRVIKPQPPARYEFGSGFRLGQYTQTRVDRNGFQREGLDVFGIHDVDGEWGRVCPYGAPGDRLWARETWLVRSQDARGEIDWDRHNAERDAMGRMPWASVVYAANSWETKVDGEKWRPSIFMPRWASRITLEITEVRVQRLHDITDEDAVAESCPPRGPQPKGVGSQVFDPDSPIKAFERLWRSINGDAAWFDNPWVWALTFRRVQP